MHASQFYIVEAGENIGVRCNNNPYCIYVNTYSFDVVSCVAVRLPQSN